MIKLYDYELSGNCYKLRLLMSFLNIPYEKEVIEFHPAKQHKSRAFLEINPLGQLPVIDDEGLILRDAQAILVYLASKYDPSEKWYPRQHPDLLGLVSQWLAFADSLTATASAARLHDALFYNDIDIDKARSGAHHLFRVLDQHLFFVEEAGQDWICPGTHPTIADIACFPYVMLSEEGGISRIDYPAIRRWCERFKRIRGFTVMPGVFPAGPGRETTEAVT
jgi:glutathione S-transferase